MQQTENSRTSTAPRIAELNHLGIIQVHGNDSAEFLHNLLTNDIKNIAPNTSRLCGLCNPKGRLLAIIVVVRQQQDYLLLLPKELAEFVQQRLTMFILRSKVSLHRVDAELCVSALIGESVTDLTALLADTDVTVTPLPSISDTQLVISPQSKMADLNNQLQKMGCQTATEAAWTAHVINNGLAQIFSLSKEAFTPQQVNLDLVDGVSFKKGCYPGQEVVARLHYLGTPSRRLFIAKMTTQDLPQPNTDVVDESGEVLGQVVQAVFIEPEKVLLQLSMKLAMTDRTAYVSGVALSEMTCSHPELSAVDS